MFLLDLLMIVWAYASNRWLYEIVPQGYIRDYFTGRQNKKTTENQRWRLTVIYRPIDRKLK